MNRPTTAEPGSPDRFSACWSCRIATAAGVLAWTLAVLLALGDRLTFTYRPYAGVIGPPAYLDYAPAREPFYYLVGVGVAIMLGWIAFGWLRHRRKSLAWALVLLLSGGAAASYALIAFDSAAAEFIKGLLLETAAIQLSPGATPLLLPIVTVQLLALGFIASLLDWPGVARRQPLFFEPVAGPYKPPPATTAELFAGWAGLILPAFLHFWLLLRAFLPTAATAVPLAAAAALALAATQFPTAAQNPLPRRKRWPWPVRLERWSFWAVAAAPLTAWWLRLGRTLGWSLPRLYLCALAAVALVLLLLGCASWRRRAGWASPIDPHLLLAWSSFTLLTVGGALMLPEDFDGFHQGELTYPAFALNHGLVPFRDIFYVHGFGIDTLFGWLQGHPTWRTHSLEYIYYCALGGVGAAILTLACLRLWGAGWWLLAAAMGLLVAAAAGPGSGRYLPIWLAVPLIQSFAESQRLRWLAFLGLLSFSSFFLTLDAGMLMLTAGGLWLLLWVVPTWNPGSGLASGQRIVYPVVTSVVGVLAVAIPFVWWLLDHGILTDFIQLHVEYGRAKSHGDNLPFYPAYVAQFISPLATVLGFWAWIGIVRRRDRSALSGTIVFLMLVNGLVFARAILRADYGHFVYALISTWVLLACLAVWRARPHASADANQSRTAEKRIYHSPEALARSLMAVAILVILPYTGQAISGESYRSRLLITPPSLVRYYNSFVQQPFVKPVDPARIPPFFQLVQELGDKVNPELATDAGHDFYDFANQPALYVWLRRLAPTRFFTPDYAASLPQQMEVVSTLERHKPRWILWRSPDVFWNAHDGIPTWLRQWRIAIAILDRYRVTERLPSGGIVLERKADTESILTDTRDYSDVLALPLQGTAPLGSVPWVWGRSTQGVPPLPGDIIWESPEVSTRGRPLQFPLDDGAETTTSTEADIYLRQHEAGEARLSWGPAGTDQPSGTATFDVAPEFPGPYRVLLANLPAWRWSKPPAWLSLEAPGRDVQVRIRLGRHGPLALDSPIR